AGGANDVAIDRFRAEVNTVGVQYAHSQVLVSSYFRAAVTRVAAARTAGGAGSRTWLYDFAFHSPVTGVAGHCMELPFAWDLLEAEGVEAQFGSTPPRALAEQMHSDWVAFIEGGAVCWLTAEEGGTGARRYNEVTSWDANAYLLESQLTNPRS
ncbi:MAG: Carboxylesterase, partial [Glaciihabitans sp.]|nr:Carboxylesterase [Glaciihabitans sp.]